MDNVCRPTFIKFYLKLKTVFPQKKSFMSTTYLSWIIIAATLEESIGSILISGSISTLSDLLCVLYLKIKISWVGWSWSTNLESEWSEPVSLWPLIRQINQGKWIAEMILKDKIVMMVKMVMMIILMVVVILAHSRSVGQEFKWRGRGKENLKIWDGISKLF